jgi:acyl carrier protein
MIAESEARLESTIHRIFVDQLELDVDVDTDVLTSGILDSVAFVQLLMELEQEFGLRVDVTELQLDDFTSVARIARFVSASRNGGA